MRQKNFECIGNRDDHLIEELSELATACNEAIKAMIKIKRFGPNNYHPKDQERRTNLLLFSDCIGDVMREYGDVLKRFGEFVGKEPS